MKKKLFTCLAVLLTAALLLTGCSNAAVDTNYADVVGYVVDGEGNPVVGVTVDLPYAATATEVSTVASARSLVSKKAQKTDDKGMFTFENLPSGTYLFEVYQEQDKKTGVVEYAKTTGYLSVPVITAGANVDADGNYQVMVENIILPKLGATLGGTVILNTVDMYAEDIVAASKEIVLDLTTCKMPTVTGTGTKDDPYAVTYSQYVKATTDANGVVSFTNLPIMTYYTGTQRMTVSYFDLTTNQQRSSNLNYDTDGTDDTAIYFGGLYPLTFTAGKIYLATPTLSLNLVSTNTKDQYNNTNILALASDITLTFDRDVAAVTQAFVLTNNSNNEIVDVAVTMAGAVVTVNPAVDLAYNTSYTLTGTVRTADYASRFVTVTFSTIPDPAQPVVPVFAVAAKNTTAGTYDSGDTSINVTASSVNTIINNYFIESRYTGEATWKRAATIDNTIDTSSTFNGTTYAFAITSPDAVVSGKTLELRMVAQTTVAGKTIEVVSAVATVADATAPASFTGELVSATAATATVAGKYVYRVTLSGNQPMTAPVLAFSLTTLTATIVDDSDDQKQTSYLVTITEPAGNAAALGTVTLTLKDAAGNSYDSNAVTAGVQDPVRNVYDGLDW